jgi:hypothetical protein
MDREEDPATETEELQRHQGEREAAERREAETATEDAETAQHERRADKAAYLREKLEERAQAEREAAEEDGQ